MSGQGVWKREEHRLEEAAGSISCLRKEISKEAEIDASVQLEIRQKVDNLKQNAVALANRLENEKHKNAELETIIRFIQSQREQEKQQEASYRDGGGCQNLANLDGRLKKLEYDLGHLSGKVNRLGENVDTKRAKINQNRTERVIDSGIFRNIQKQLITSELKFKKLLIQKIKYQREYDRLLKEYEEMKKKADSWKQDTKGRVVQSPSGRIVFPEPFQRKFIQIEEKPVKSYGHNLITTDGPLDAEVQSEEQHKVITIQKILSHVGLQNCEDLVHYFNSTDTVNDGIFNEMNNLSDQSEEIESYMELIAKEKKLNRMHFYEQRKELSKNLMRSKKAKEIKLRIDQTHGLIDSQMQEFAKLLNQSQFKTFQENIGLQPMTAQSISGPNFGEILEGLKIVQSSIQQYLRESVAVQEEQPGITSRAVCQQKLLEMLNKVQHDECMKVMKKDEFKEEYSKLMKCNSNTRRGKLVHSMSKRSTINIMSKR